MAKICIVLFSNIKYAPYFNLYSNYLDSIGEHYDVIYLNRNTNVDDFDRSNYYSLYYGECDGTIKKIKSFLLFRKECIKIIKRNKYKKIIVLTTLPAILLGSFLVKHYKNNYVVDVRDYTFEKYKFYRALESRIFSNSFCTFISSPNFTNFLPVQCKYSVFHNLNNEYTKKEINLTKKTNSTNIIIAYIGSIAYLNECKKLINLVKDDNRFCFYFYGNDNTDGEITDYIKFENNERIKMFGPFNPDEKGKIYLSSDIIFNCYGNERMLVKYALSNKLYDAFFYNKPLLVSPNTAMKEQSLNYSFAIDLNKCNNLDELYQWFMTFNHKNYKDYAIKFINKCTLQNNDAMELIKRFINANK